MKRLTQQQRIKAAMDRLEFAQTELMRAAYECNPGDVLTWAGESQSREVLRYARAYATAIRSLAAIRGSKAP